MIGDALVRDSTATKPKSSSMLPQKHSTVHGPVHESVLLPMLRAAVWSDRQPTKANAPARSTRLHIEAQPSRAVADSNSG
jgi:hypothetical protein